MSNGSDTTTPSDSRAAVLLGVAVALTMVYVIALVVLYLDADDKGVSETIWARYTFLIGGLEAVVFTAVGWMFGKEVHRKQAEQAVQAHEDAKASAASEAAAKAKGQALKSLVLGQSPDSAGGIGAAAARPVDAAPLTLETLRTAASTFEF